jgi:hypothetical protein
MPPAAVRATEYELAKVLPGREVVLMETGGKIMIERLAEAVLGGLFESVTVTVKLEVPVAVGVPVIAPLEALRLSPAGSEPLVSAQV